MIIWNEFTEKSTTALVKEQLKSPIAIKLNLEIRKYQIVAALHSYESLSNNKNVVLNLPTGTGKTMVANILSLMILSNNPETHCLYVAPSRSLCFQHFTYTKWLAPRYQSLLLTEESSPDKIFTWALRSNILITTPELCANLFRSNLIPKSVQNSISLLSIDEFDDSFVFEYTNSGPRARLDQHIDKLNKCLPSNIPTQLISATDPKALISSGNKDPEIKAYSSLMDKIYSPEVITIPKKLYFRHIPTAMIKTVGVDDFSVTKLSESISVEMALVFDQIYLSTGCLLDRDDVLTKLESIINHKVTMVKLYTGGVTKVNHINASYFSTLRFLLNCHEHLYEDLFYGFDYEIRLTKIFSLSKMEFVFMDLPRLIDNRGCENFNVELKGKLNALINIVLENKDKSGVIFTRTKLLSDALYSEVNKLGFSTIQVDSRFADINRDKRIVDFQTGKYKLLIITRRTGRRGLDLPCGEYSVFYNPKSKEATTWQELSRIRSSVSHTKKSYFLFYMSTADERRMGSLVECMKSSGREYLFDDNITRSRLNKTLNYVSEFTKDINGFSCSRSRK